MMIVMFFSLVPKLAYFSIFIDLWTDVLNPLVGGVGANSSLYRVFVVIGALTLVVGVGGTFYQTKVKRFLGYSTIVHSGFMLLSVLGSSSECLGVFLLYYLCYSVNTVGMFTYLL